MSWHTARMLLLDFETTGVDPHRDRVVTAASIEVGGGVERITKTWLIDPVIEIPDAAAEVHGITTDHAREHGADAGTSILDIGTRVAAAISRDIPVVGHNVGPYDLTMLVAELIRHGHRNLANQVAGIRLVVDTGVIEKHLDQYRPAEPGGRSRRPAEACGSHQLIDCCRLWGIDLDAADAHGAEADALAAGRLAWRLATDPLRFAQWDWRPQQRIDPARMSLADLFDWQVQQYATSAAGFQDYVRTKRPEAKGGLDPEFVANTLWPICPPPAGWTPEQLPEPMAVPA